MYVLKYIFIYVLYKEAPKMASQPVKCLQNVSKRLQMSPKLLQMSPKCLDQDKR